MKHAIALLLLASLFFLGCTGGEAQPQSQQGTLYFIIKDKPLDLQNVSSVRITVTEAKVLSPQQGWITVFSGSQSFDLMQLSGSSALLAQANISPGNYTQARLIVQRAVITLNGVDTDAVIPSSELKFASLIRVQGNSSSALVLDFDLNHSLHATGQGKIIFAPVLKVESKAGSSVSVQNNNASVQGGQTTDSEAFGMDEKGNLNKGQGIPDDAVLEVDSQGNVQITAHAEQGQGESHAAPEAQPALQQNLSLPDNFTPPAGASAECVRGCAATCLPQAASSCEAGCNSRLNATCDTDCAGSVSMECQQQCNSVSLTQSACIATCTVKELPKCKSNCVGDADTKCKVECKSAQAAYAACLVNCTGAC